MDIFSNENTTLLVRSLLSLNTREEMESFLEDVMTSKEIVALGQRIAVARLLLGSAKYSEVEAATGASSATIGRVNRCIQFGRGGYKTALGRLEGSEDGD